MTRQSGDIDNCGANGTQTNQGFRISTAPYEPKTFDLRGELYRIFGVDLTNVPGISAITAQTILCEIGTDVSRFRNASAFASWLGFVGWSSPNAAVYHRYCLIHEQDMNSVLRTRSSGGKVLHTKSRRVTSRVATALRMAANSLHHAKDYLGEFFRPDHLEARQAPSNYGHGSQTG